MGKSAGPGFESKRPTAPADHGGGVITKPWLPVFCACALSEGCLSKAPKRVWRRSGYRGSGWGSHLSQPDGANVPERGRTKRRPTIPTRKIHRTGFHLEPWTSKRSVLHCYLTGSLLGDASTRLKGTRTPGGKVRAQRSFPFVYSIWIETWTYQSTGLSLGRGGFC